MKNTEFQSIKSASTIEKLSLQRKKHLKFLFFTSLIILIVVALFAYRKININTLIGKKNYPKVNIMGHDYELNLVQVPGADKAADANNPEYYAGLAKDLETKLAKAKPTSSDYYDLARLYVSADNNTKALKYLKLAKANADPKSSGYKSFIKLINEYIKNIEKRQ